MYILVVPRDGGQRGETAELRPHIFLKTVVGWGECPGYVKLP